MPIDGNGGIVILGGGHAGIQLADSLREQGYVGAVTIVEATTLAPYQRPPLSKDHLAAAGETPEALPLRGEDFFRASDVRLLGGAEVLAVDRTTRTVLLAGGSSLGYDHLVFATGARNRVLTVPGAGLAGVLGLRSLDDAEEVRDRLTRVSRAVVIGAGFIGLEFAAAAAVRGIAVTVVEAADRPMKRALSEPMSNWFAVALPKQGIEVRYNEGVTAIRGADGVATGVELATGEVLPAELVLVGIGVIPADEIARESGLKIDNGIVVDSRLSTNDPSVSAIGDCAQFPNAHAGAPMRLESVQNANDHARLLARRLAAGDDSEYRATPWFWTHQGSLKLNIVGINRPGLEVLTRGDPELGRFSLFGFDGEELVCVESVNAMADHMAARRLFDARVLPSREQISSADFDFRAFAKVAGAAHEAAALSG